MKKNIGLIPARWGSVRFPGKPLAEIAGKTMIERVYLRASKAKLLNDLFVVTDDERIEYECKKNLLNASCKNSTVIAAQIELLMHLKV